MQKLMRFLINPGGVDLEAVNIERLVEQLPDTVLDHRFAPGKANVVETAQGYRLGFYIHYNEGDAINETAYEAACASLFASFDPNQLTSAEQAVIDRQAELAEILERYATLDTMTFLEIVATIDQRRDNVVAAITAATSLADVRAPLLILAQDTYDYIGPLLAWALKRGIER